MSQVLLIIHLIVALSLVVSILLQRSEGGGLGIGGGGSGGLVSSRGSANFLTRVTAVLAGGFMATSLTLAILASHGSETQSIVQQIPMGQDAPAEAPADPTVPLN
ncbi:preprotein translocase subunit SecG [Fodinicurvata sp. EGI_FJ10296]|uniref:preprotein translocase subunit SecG n=1 Tax=Fodinicurvata sp. EGI_FJ10296 TaxID=3231908 RepID=UPI0034556691